ncbi:serine/threonine-protein kinase B-raf-like [Haliotis rufescens]|uniref:serine/threonine-protein kinase B-raf-like n=1 Tax=Haliotis rufescens TaxID=6454 RepID=UPI001EB01303|nr:serine/threonine-protein kinase B-raf-like [Haliotis rufescens]XP_046358860.1 serine/threonine-protein kinase B-raf-like [Haliotis rufescens]
MTAPVRAQVPTSLYDERLMDRTFRSGKLKRYDDNTCRRRLITGEEHWTKVLQVNANSSNSRHLRCRGCSRSPSPRPGGPIPRHPSPSPRHHSACPNSPPRDRKRRSKSLGRTGDGLFHNLTNRFRQWIQSKRKYEISPTDCMQADDRYVWNKEQVFEEDVALRSYRSSFHDQNVPNNEFNSVQDNQTANLAYSKGKTVVQITYSDAKSDHDADDAGDPPADVPHLLKPPDISGRQLLRASRYKHREKQLNSAGPGCRQPLTGTISCPPKQGPEPNDVSPRFRRRCATWPVQGRKVNSEDADNEDLDVSFLHDSVFGRTVLDGKMSIEDFSIPYEDVSVTDCVRVGRRCTIHRGRWHGEVTIHLFGDKKGDETDVFWSDLTKLCRIRHENINLFMGACTLPPNRAVITSAPAGLSLYENIHCKKEKLNIHSQLQILRQVAVGMGYLHAKGIVLRKLNTKNVFLAPKVKISAMDYGFAESKYDRINHSSIPRGHMTYVAPEILCTMVTLPPRFVTSSPYTNEADVYAFGTVMYEVLSGRFPYNDVPVESLIWQVCKGRRQGLATLTCTSALKDLIEDCWAHEPCYRPDFPELSKELLKNSPMYKRHSSSEPERLHRTGSFMERISPF